MTDRYNPDKHRRHSLRLKGWDYTTPGGYFITICTYQQGNLFEESRFREVAENAWQHIPTQPHAAHVDLDEWVVMPNHLHGILMVGERGENDDPPGSGRGETGSGRGEATRNVGGFPNVSSHRVASPLRTDANESPHRPTGVTSGSVGAIVGNFKSLVTRRVNNLQRTPGAKVWQRGYYDRIIRNERELAAIRDYIRENPRRWAEDRENLEGLLARMRWMDEG